MEAADSKGSSLALEMCQLPELQTLGFSHALKRLLEGAQSTNRDGAAGMKCGNLWDTVVLTLA